jgi:hypothetical protein
MEERMKKYSTRGRWWLKMARREILRTDVIAMRKRLELM